MLNYLKSYVCPYCGFEDILYSFIIKKKDGTNSKFVRCPYCKINMKLKTLIADMSLYEWGLWLYINIRMFNNPHDRFREKVKMDKIILKLNSLGRIYKKEFWDGWNYGKEKYDFEGTKILNELNDKYGIYDKKRRNSKLDDF